MSEINKSLDRDSTQMKILNTAIREFAEYGKAGARVDRIAKQAGVNKAMIYYHFNSKDNLYYASITEHFDRVAAILKQRISYEQSIEEMISSVVEVYIRIFNENTYFKKILLRELTEDNSPVIKKISEIISQSGVPNILYNKLLSEIKHGRVKKIDIKQAIISLISMNIGFFIILPIATKILNVVDFDKFLSDRKDAVVELFLNGVLVK